MSDRLTGNYSMEYEYNGDLAEEDRVNQVMLEIIKEYPQIGIGKAREAARLESPISTRKTARMELERLYFIMLANRDDKDLILPIFRDYLNILDGANEEDVDIHASLDLQTLRKLAVEIKAYFQNDREFPFPSDGL